VTRETRVAWWRAGAVAVVVPMTVCLAVVAVHYDGRHFVRGDGLFYLVTARSLQLDGDLDLSNQLAPPLDQWSGHVALDRRGRLVPKHPVAFAVASIPFFALFGPPGALIFNLLLLAGAFALAFILAARVARPWPAAAAVVLTGLASFLPHYAWNYSPDVFSTTLLLAGMVALGRERRPTWWRDGLAGLLIGLSCSAKYVLVVVATWVALLVRAPRYRCLSWVVGLLIPLVAVAALNVHLFGSPWVTGYDRMVDLHGAAPRLSTDRERLGWPTAAEVGAVLFAPRYGLVTTSPITVLGLLGLPLLWKRDRRLATMIVGATALLVLLLSSYLEGRLALSSHYGNRYLIPIVLLAAIPLAVLLERAFQRRLR
jgi:4-amino-4-deoxy-L-arabinose transferase-like glycosyltransferase